MNSLINLRSLSLTEISLSETHKNAFEFKKQSNKTKRKHPIKMSIDTFLGKMSIHLLQFKKKH